MSLITRLLKIPQLIGELWNRLICNINAFHLKVENYPNIYDLRNYFVIPDRQIDMLLISQIVFGIWGGLATLNRCLKSLWTLVGRYLIVTWSILVHTSFNAFIGIRPDSIFIVTWKLRVANVRLSHVVFLKFSTAVFESSDSVHKDCSQLSWFTCFCRSFVSVCYWRVGIWFYVSDKKVWKRRGF